MKVASFTVRATMAQSIRWKQAAEGEGFASVGSWAGRALDAYLEARTRAGRPDPPCVASRHPSACSWTATRSPCAAWCRLLFGIFRGTAEGPGLRACQRFTLVHLPPRRIIATLRSLRQCQALAAELAPLYARDEASEAAAVARHVSEQA